MKHLFLISLLTGTALILSAGSYEVNDKKSESSFNDGNDKPNVLLVLIDDLGWSDVAVYNPNTNYSTPNIDALAEQGVLFTDGYAASPICSPTRAALITGQHPTKLGTTDFFRDKSRRHRYKEGKFKPADFEEQLPANTSTIASELKQVGYQTAYLGKWHLGQTQDKWPEHYGFDLNIGGHAAGSPRGGYFSPYINPRLESGPKGEYLTDRLTSEAINVMTKLAKSDQPFFVMMAYYSVHTPLGAPKALVEKYADKFSDTDPKSEFTEVEQVWPTEKPRLSRVKQTNATYAAMVEKVDENIGRLINSLEEQNLNDDTIVVLLSDNGGLSTAEGLPTSNLPLRGGKGWLYEGGIRVPFIINVPGAKNKGQSLSVPVTSMDIAPTIYDIVGIDVEAITTLDGQSLKPVLEGKKLMEERALFFHYPHYSNQGGFPGAAVRIGDWKLLERFEDGQLQLFNLADDPEEQQDLAARYPSRVSSMRQQLHQWYKTHNAEFLRTNPKLPQFGEPWRPQD